MVASTTQWWEWTGWAFIGNVAQILSLLAIVFAVYELLERRRRVSSRSLTIDSYATATIDGRVVELFEMGPAGLDDIHVDLVTFVGCSYVPRDEYRLRWRLNAGTLNTIALESEDFASAWILVAWTVLTDKRTEYFAWYPLTRSGDAYRVSNEQIDRDPPRTHLWQFWRGRSRALVGNFDGGTWRRAVRGYSSGSVSIMTKELEKLHSVGGKTMMAGRF